MALVRELKPAERESIANATQLIRDAGDHEKADLLDDMLQDNDIIIDHELERNVLGTADKTTLGPFEVRLSEEISLNPRLFANIFGLPRTLTRKDPELVRLAMVLHHEADHILCDDELAAFGGEISFALKLNAEFEKFFPGLTPSEKAKVEKEKKRMEGVAQRTRNTIARAGGRGYGDGFRQDEKPNKIDVLRAMRMGDIPLNTEIRKYPGKPVSGIQLLLDIVGEKILLFDEINNRFPKNLSEVISQAKTLLTPHEQGLLSLKTGPGRASKTSITDMWGNRLIYLLPGRIFNDRFDLYSLGECGEDKGGEWPNILYLLDRR